MYLRIVQTQLGAINVPASQVIREMDKHVQVSPIDRYIDS